MIANLSVSLDFGEVESSYLLTFLLAFARPLSVSAELLTLNWLVGSEALAGWYSKDSVTRIWKMSSGIGHSLCILMGCEIVLVMERSVDLARVVADEIRG